MRLHPPTTNPDQEPGSANVPYFKGLIETHLHKRNLPVDVPIKLEPLEWAMINEKLRDVFTPHHIEVTKFDSITDISNMYTGRMHMIEVNSFNNKI